MKLVVTIVQDYDADRLLRAVTDAGFGVTRVASTGGFLRTGNTTLLMGVEEACVDRCLDVIAATCGARVERSDDAPAILGGTFEATDEEMTVGGAVAFVLTVSRFERFEATEIHTDGPGNA